MTTPTIDHHAPAAHATRELIASCGIPPVHAELLYPRLVELLAQRNALLAALRDLIPTPFPDDAKEDCQCVEVLIPIYQLRAARAALATGGVK